MLVQKTKASRALAIFMAVVMCFTMTSTVGFAAEKEAEKKEVNLLVIGDSTGSGYLMPDYLNSNCGFSMYNNYLDSWWTPEAADKFAEQYGSRAGRMSNEAYPWLLKKHIEKTEGVDCKLIPLTINGMRTDEFRALLDDEFCQKVIKREEAYTEQMEKERGVELPYHSGFLRLHMDWFRDAFYDGVQNYDGYPNIGEPAITERTLEAAQEYTRQAVREADTIIFDDCTNNFGTYNGGRISAYMGIPGQEYWTPNILDKVDDVDELPQELKDTLNGLEATITKSVPMLKEGPANQLLEMFLYDLADCLVNYTADLEMIRELNPDAKIIVVGMSNPLEGVSISSGGTTIDFGKVTGALFQMVNTYIRTLDKNADNIYYADIYTNNVTTFVSQIMNSTLEELLADDDMEHGNYGNYAINLFSKGMANELMGMNISSMEDLDKTNPFLADVIRETVYEALKNHGNLDVAGVSAAVSSGSFDSIGKYVKAQTVKKNVDASGVPAEQYDTALDNALADASCTRADLSLDEAYWCLLNVYTRFILSSGIGLHPNKAGCAEKYDAVLEAYVKSIENPEATAYSEYKAEWKEKIGELRALLDGTKAGEDLDAAIDKINKAVQIMDMLEAEGLTPEKMQELVEMKNLLSQRIEEVLAAFDLTMDDLYQAAMTATEPENVQKVAEQIKVMKDLIDRIPKTKDEAKEELLKQLDNVQKILDENALGLSEELLTQLTELNGLLKQAVTDEDYQAIADALLPIGQKLLAIGEAVAGLPEYEAAMAEYMELSDAALAQLDDRVASLEEQTIKLTAKSIKVSIDANVTFPGSTVKATLRWATDEDAAGYDLKKNGKDVNAVEGDGEYTFEDPDVLVGETYEYEVIPYVIGNDGQKVSGKTFKATIIPKVTLAKAKLKKVTAKKASFKATWKDVKGASGYQLSYKTGKTTKVKNYDSAKKLSATVNGLKANKKYTVKVRAYKTVNNVKYFGAWSKTKKVKTK